MRIKTLIYSTLALSFSGHQIAQAQSIQDSLFADTDAANLSYCYYKVNKKQTLYHISKTFRVNPDNMMMYNHALQGKALMENDILKIPVNKLNIQFEKKQFPDSSCALYYQVKKSESLFHIAKRKFEIDIKKLLQLNKIKNTTIHEGSVLLLGYYPLNSSPHLIEQNQLFSLNEPPQKEFIESELLTKQSRGVAISQYDLPGSGRLFALHNTAAMDSQIEIENPITNRKVYAKVIGRIPPIYERDVQIIVSAETARMLGAVDKRFFVSIRYR